MQIKIIGDVGGWTHAYLWALRQAGVGADLRVPDDTILIQMGDVVRLRPHYRQSNVECLRLTLGLAESERFVQLWGNHEELFVRGEHRLLPPELFENSISPEALSMVEDMRQIALDQWSIGEYTFSHAGLTRGYLNNPRMGVDSVIHGGPPNLAADPLWADGVRELIASWETHDSPPKQVVGHSSPMQWNQGILRPDAPADDIRIDHDTRSCWWRETILFADPVWQDTGDFVLPRTLPEVQV